EKDEAIYCLQRNLRDLQASMTWRTAERLISLRHAVCPMGSLRHRAALRLLHAARMARPDRVLVRAFRAIASLGRSDMSVRPTGGQGDALADLSRKPFSSGAGDVPQLAMWQNPKMTRLRGNL